MQIIFRLIPIVFFLFLLPHIHSQVNSKQFSGSVVKIVDGDTYDILLTDKNVFRIRMNGIDAPEKGQAYSQKAKDYLGKIMHESNHSNPMV
jgi:endonuclease YncB( thermonuclease family)